MGVIFLLKSIGFIVDGNRRWAQKKGLPKMEGHRQGFNKVMDVVDFFLERSPQQVETLVFYLFSTENWKREEKEVSYLMNLAYEMAKRKMNTYIEKGVRFVHLGRREPLPQKVLDVLDELVERSKNNTRLTVGLALNYGGRQEIIDAINKIIDKVRNGEIPAGAKINKKLIEHFLYYPDFSDVDLIVRTSGEMRISNFLLWQSAYAEFIFLPYYWPEINDNILYQIIEEFNRRERRFGK